MKKFDDYEYLVIKEIAFHEVEPSIVQKTLSTIGKPVDKLMEYAHKAENKYIQKAIKGIDKTVLETLKGTIKVANLTTNEENIKKEFKKKFNIIVTDIEEIKSLPLKQLDRVADSYDISNGIIVATEGALMGVATTLAEAIPFAQLAIPAIITADVTASMTFMSRHVCQIATAYGYSSYDSVNIPDILSAMAPTSTSSDESFLILKAAAIHEVRDAAKFAAKRVGDLLDDMATPRLISLIRAVAQKLGIILTEKELGLLVPIAGAVVNGGLNLAFQQTNHVNAKDYFRKLHLVNKYGEAEVTNVIMLEKELIMKKAVG